MRQVDKETVLAHLKPVIQAVAAVSQTVPVLARLQVQRTAVEQITAVEEPRTPREPMGVMAQGRADRAATDQRHHPDKERRAQRTSMPDGRNQDHGFRST